MLLEVRRRDVAAVDEGHRGDDRRAGVDDLLVGLLGRAARGDDVVDEQHPGTGDVRMGTEPRRGARVEPLLPATTGLRSRRCGLPFDEPPARQAELCGDGKDNDGDNFTDCDDKECCSLVDCSGKPTSYCGKPKENTAEQCAALNALYDQMWVYYNLFQPVLHLIEKTHDGTRIRRKWDAAQTPFARLLATDTLAAAARVRLERLYAETNPRALRRAIQAGLHALLYPRRGDWAVTDAQGNVVRAGLFDNRWLLY